MGYYEFRITSSPESREALVEKTSSMGALGSIVEEDLLVAYFPDLLGIREIVAELTSFRVVLTEVGLSDDFAFEFVFISERDWNETWKKRFQPLDLGDRLTIIPPWEAEREGRVNLIIDPGMAFGTGHHETTTRCLLLIEEFSRRSPGISDRHETVGTESFLDVGTGTGILAIAASKLGFVRVLGVDIDPLAVDAARRNVLQNGLTNVRILEGSVTSAPDSYDFVAANLLSETLMSLAPDLLSRLNPGGLLAASGMIEGQEESLIAGMEAAGLRLSRRYLDGRWVSAVFRR